MTSEVASPSWFVNRLFDWLTGLRLDLFHAARRHRIHFSRTIFENKCIPRLVKLGFAGGADDVIVGQNDIIVARATREQQKAKER